MKEILPNPENGTLEEVEIVRDSTPCRKHSGRLLAIRLLFEGRSRTDVSQIVNRSQSTLIRWINRWNEGGIDALVNRPKPGRPPKVNNEQRQRIVALMNDPELAGEDHWTGVKIWGYLREKEKIYLGYSTLIRLFHDENFCLKVPRSWPEKQDPDLRDQFKRDISILLNKEDIEVWFGDESGFLADPRPRQMWVVKGSKVKTTRTGIHLRESIVGAVCPESGELSAIVIDRVDTEVFQAFIDQLAEHTKGRKVVLVLDNATWHKAVKLKWKHIVPMYLPPYSPDLNPSERLWLVMKNRYFVNWFTNSREILTDRVCKAFKSLIDNPVEVKSICAV
jgi:transposase